MAFDKDAYRMSRKMGFRGQGVLKKLPFRPHPKGSQPINLGIKEYKKTHSHEPKRVLYYKSEMWKAFHELKEEK